MRKSSEARGVSHQTGWTVIIGRATHLFAATTAEQGRDLGRAATVVEVEPKAAATGTRALTWRNRSILRSIRSTRASG